MKYMRKKTKHINFADLVIKPKSKHTTRNRITAVAVAGAALATAAAVLGKDKSNQ